MALVPGRYAMTTVAARLKGRMESLRRSVMRMGPRAMTVEVRYDANGACYITVASMWDARLEPISALWFDAEEINGRRWSRSSLLRRAQQIINDAQVRHHVVAKLLGERDFSLVIPLATSFAQTKEIYAANVMGTLYGTPGL